MNDIDKRASRNQRRDGRRLFIGIDGGGSGCRARIADDQGEVLGRGEGPPAALRLGIERSLAAVENAGAAAAAAAGLPAGDLRQMDAVVGLAGVGRKGLLAALIARPHPFKSVRYVNDATIACFGAHGGRDGGVVIVGTGSVGLAILNGREIRIGGYGFPVSDGGSGAALGLGAIRVALKSHDGRISKTPLGSEVMRRFQDDPLEVIAWADTATATDYARFAPLVLDFAEQGDWAASDIVRVAAKEIEQLAMGLFQCGAPRVALVGGLSQRMLGFLAPDVAARLASGMGDAIDGALLLARGMIPEGAIAAKEQG